MTSRKALEMIDSILSQEDIRPKKRKHKKRYIEEYQDMSEVEPTPKRTSPVKEPVREVAKKISDDMMKEIKSNIKETKEYVHENRNQILVDLIDTMVLFIDIMNGLLKRTFHNIYLLVMASGDGNLVNRLKIMMTEFFDWISQLAIGRVEQQQIDKKYQITRFWKAYKRCSPDEKERLLEAYFNAIGIGNYEHPTDREITYDDIVKIVSQQL
jgi:hypothetical protein